MDELSANAHRVVMAAFPGPVAPRWVLDRLAYGLGSVCLFGSNVETPEQLRTLTQRLHDAAPEVLLATDEEGGDVTRLHMQDGSPFPGNAALGAVDDEALTCAVAARIGEELASVGIDLDLAPVVDVNSNPDNPVIGVRSFGAEPALVARHTEAYVRGLQSAGIGACVKHFPGHGDTAVDSHLGLPTVDGALEDLRTTHLRPFSAALAAEAVAVMTSHVLLPVLDGRYPATLSAAVLGVLRKELGFDGLVVSDALDMAGASAGRGEPAAAVLALSAGCDLLCLGPDKEDGLVQAVVTAVVRAVRDGTLPANRLAEAAARVQQAAKRVRVLQEARTPGAYDGDLGRLAAGRAIRVSGELPGLHDALVLRFRTSANIAVGDVPWGLPADGSTLRGRPVVDIDEDWSAEQVVGAAAGRSVVALVREGHRHRWVGALLTALAARGAELVTVEMGWPGVDPLPGSVQIWTYGASTASGRALDAVLAKAVA